MSGRRATSSFPPMFQLRSDEKYRSSYCLRLYCTELKVQYIKHDVHHIVHRMGMTIGNGFGSNP